MALSPSLTVAITPCNCGALGGLYVLVDSLTYPSPGRMFGPSCCGRLPWRVTGLTYSHPPRTSRTVSCLTCSQDSQLLRHPAIDIVWRCPCLSRFRLLQTPCYCGVLGGLSVLVGFLTYPSIGWLLWASWLDTWPEGLAILLLGLDYGIKPHRWGWYCLCVTVSLLASAFLIIEHIPPSLLMMQIVLCMCSGNVLNGYVIFI